MTQTFPLGVPVGAPSAGRSGTRADIQALRAFAVLAVVFFHIWPHAVSGGYIGVDVFFVISGYLITGQLLRRRERGSLGLGSFWAARARRLLPASLLVLLVSVALTLTWAPATLQSQYLRSVIGSALYVENWVLAWDAVDYLGADNAPPIAQHYWSLAVEEQFYVFWPLLLILATIGVKTVVAQRRRLLATVAVLSAGSLVFAVWLTFTNPSLAYFATPARVWQFGFGAIVAIVPRLPIPRPLATVLRPLAWATLAATAVLYSPATPFPGYAAIAPTAAVMVLIAIGAAQPESSDRIVGLRPIQWIGDQSYGIYLWHWPLVVILPHVLGRPADLPENIALLAATILLAALSKRFVEDPIRFGRPAKLRPRSIGIATVAAMIVVVAAAAVPIWVASSSAASASEAASAELLDPGSCRGASMLREPGCGDAQSTAFPAEELIPRLESLYDDTGGAFACYQSDASRPIDPCALGSDAPGALRIAVTGDSHAAMLLPALTSAATENGWSLDAFVGRGCVWTVPASPDCVTRMDALSSALVDGDYDVIIVTAWNSLDRSDPDRREVADGYRTAWSAALATGTRIIPVIDNPGVPQSAADCLSTTPMFTARTCTFPSEQYLRTDPLRLAAEDLHLPVVDLSDAYCTSDGQCPMVAGGVIVYRDLHHITASFSRTLTPYLSARIDEILR